MTIRRGEPYGAPASLAPEDPVAVTDAEAAAIVCSALANGSGPPTVGLLGGDLHRTLGAPRRTLEDLREGNGMAFPVDCGVLHIGDGGDRCFVAHLVAAGGGPLWRGRTVIVANAAFDGPRNIGPCAHPNDGLLDVTDGRLGWRDRRVANRRLLTGSHLPHPGLRERRGAEYHFDGEVELMVRLDGEPVGRMSSFEVAVRPDALVVIV